MSRYIDAEKAIILLGVIKDRESSKRAMNAISKTPTEDVVPVKHARWEESEGEFRCTNCRAILEEDMQMWHNFYYCYHCGAKMEEGNAKND